MMFAFVGSLYFYWYATTGASANPWADPTASPPR